MPAAVAHTMMLANRGALPPAVNERRREQAGRRERVRLQQRSEDAQVDAGGGERVSSDSAAVREQRDGR